MAGATPQFNWDHVHIRTSDPEGTAKWFADTLGAEIVRTPVRLDVKLGSANIFLAPVTAGDGVNPPPSTPYQGLDHFGLSVTGIDQVVADLKAKGAEFTMELNLFRPGIKICFVRGPEGVSIEVLERNPGAASDSGGAMITLSSRATASGYKHLGKPGRRVSRPHLCDATSCCP